MTMIASDKSPVQEARLATVHAGADRWRYPDWTAVCKAADRARRKRDRVHLSAVRIDPTAVTPIPRRRWRFVRRYGLGTAISLAIHASLLMVLAWGALDALSTPADDGRHVIRVHPSRESDELHLQVVEITIPSPAQVMANGPVSQPISAPTVEIDPGALPPAVTLASFLSSRSSPVGEAIALLGHAGRGIAADEQGQAGSEFFGVRANGNRFVFVVDCSRSMDEGSKWRDATRELVAALDRLTPEQFFYVVFFDGQTHPMFSSRSPEPELLPATAENRQRFDQWLDTVELGYNTRPAGAMQLALQLQPDAVFLLSDGAFEDQTAAILRQKNLVRKDGRRVPQVIVHTIGFHNREAQRVLQRIADENGGRYVFVPDPRIALAAPIRANDPHKP
jgi:hypothetical protein